MHSLRYLIISQNDISTKGFVKKLLLKIYSSTGKFGYTHRIFQQRYISAAKKPKSLKLNKPSFNSYAETYCYNKYYLNPPVLFYHCLGEPEVDPALRCPYGRHHTEIGNQANCNLLGVSCTEGYFCSGDTQDKNGRCCKSEETAKETAPPPLSLSLLFFTFIHIHACQLFLNNSKPV